MSVPPDVNAIPDLEKLTDKILEFIEFYDKPEIKKLRDEQRGNFNYMVGEQFSMLPPAMIKLLSDEENRASNLEKLMEMLSLLQSVKDGKNSFEKTENDFFEKRAEEYIYPKFGGRENFYKVSEEYKTQQELENKKNKKKK